VWRVRFGVLGPVAVWTDAGRPVAIPGRKVRALLADLLVHAGRPVPADRLIDDIWEGRPPPSAQATLLAKVSQLRRALEDAEPGGRDLVASEPAGHVLRAAPDAVDARRFSALTAQARGAEPRAAAKLLAEALELWRGPALADFADAPFARGFVAHFADQRVVAQEDAAELRLELGQHAELAGELVALVAEHPLRERLRGCALRALYRAGRQAEALASYQDLQARLADELGLDPSPELAALHQAILIRDPALDPSPPGISGVPLPRQLPAPPAVFTGRLQELAELDRVMLAPGDTRSAVAISAVGGFGGIGKTSLALAWSHRNLDRFPDGQLYANLRGFDDGAEPVAPAVVIRGFLDALGVDSQAVPGGLDTQAALYRSAVAGRRMLILLDNARDTDQVAPLLPGSPTCAVIVTSRRQLSGLVAVRGARPLTLDVLPERDARELLAGHLGRSRLSREPAATADVLRHCAGLPLALSIVATRAGSCSTSPLAAVAEELGDSPSRLDALDVGDPQADLRRVFSWSYQALSGDAARLFRLLGLHPGPDIALPAAASLAGVDAPGARPLLAELARASLLTEHRPGRFVLHDLLHAYAAEQGRRHDTDADRRAAVHRLLDHYLHTGWNASRQLNPTRVTIDVSGPAPGVTVADIADLRQAARWFGTEYPAIVSAVRHADRTGFDVHAWQLAWTVAEYLDQHAHWHDYAAVQRTALAAAERLGSRKGQSVAHRCLARACTRLGAYPDARAHLGRALDLHRELGDAAGQASVHMGFGRVLEVQGDREEALAHVQQALQLYQACDNPTGQVHALNGIGWCHALLGNYQESLDAGTEALRLADSIEGCTTTGIWDTLGYAHHRLGDHARAIDCHRKGLALARESRDGNAETEALEHLGDVFHSAGDLGAAREHWQQVHEIHQAAGRRSAAEALERKLHALTDAG